MFKRLLLVLITIFTLFIPHQVSAQEKNVNLYFFWSNSCPHCAKEKSFLQKIAPDYPHLVIHNFEVGSSENIILLQNIGKELGIETGGVPITIIGNSHFVGYLSDETTGQTIVDLLKEAEINGDPNPVGKLIDIENEKKDKKLLPTEKPKETAYPSTDIKKSAVVKNIPEQIKIPLIGTVVTKNLSLPVLTVVIAAMDGFNPCAMWTLLFLISLLLGMKDRRRMFILGSAFIIASALVYFLFLSAWLNLFLFLGYIIWVRIAIALLAVGAGGYYLRDYYLNKSGGCKVMGNEKRQKIFERIRNITQRKEFFLALGGIIILAFAVNLVELVCSAGLPAIYTQMLSLSPLNRWQHYGYLILYILIFMLDDIFIFFTAMITLQATGIQSKYSRFSHLVGGILMLIIGILLLFKPEVLMFN